jgi:membrane-associated phospholipid phosphatase
MSGMEIVQAITTIGEPLLWIAISILLILTYALTGDRWRDRKLLKKYMAIMIPSLVIALLVVGALKYGFPVARPCTPCTMVQEACNPYCPANDTSFPSGHATAAFVGFTSLWLVRKRAKCLPIFIAPAAIAWSRVALGIHTWADVLAGAVLGLAVAIAVHEAHRLRKRYLRRRGHSQA